MSRIADILNDLVSTLQAINGASTYANTLSSQQVDAVDSPLSELPDDQLPHFSVVFQGDQRLKEIGHVYSILKFEIICTFSGNTQAEIASYLSDIEIALAQDVRRSGHAIETWVQSITADNGAFEPYRVYTIGVECHATYAFGSPN